MTKKLSVNNIKAYSSNMIIWDTIGNSHNIDLDGVQGEFTKEEWRNDPVIELFDEEGQEKILGTLETMNVINE